MSDNNNPAYTNVSKAKFTRIECPFDLEAIFTLSYNTDGLKGVLEFILEHLGKFDGELKGLDEKMAARLIQVDK